MENIKKKQMEWTYGEKMFLDGIIDESKWSDDAEEVFGEMDERFDYLWNIEDDGRLYFIDRLYSAYKEDPKTYHCYYDDNTGMKERMETNEAEMWFDTFDDVRTWMERKRKGE